MRTTACEDTDHIRTPKNRQVRHRLHLSRGTTLHSTVEMNQQSTHMIPQGYDNSYLNISVQCPFINRAGHGQGVRRRHLTLDLSLVCWISKFKQNLRRCTNLRPTLNKAGTIKWNLVEYQMEFGPGRLKFHEFQ